MNLTASSTVAGDLATKWHRFAASTVVNTMVAATQLLIRIGPHLHPGRCRLFRRVRVPVVALDAVAMAVADIADHPAREAYASSPACSGGSTGPCGLYTRFSSRSLPGAP